MKTYSRWLVGQWDRVAGWGCVAAGAVLVLLGAISVSDAQNVLDQLSYLASSVAIGLFLLGVGAILVLTADSRDEWGKLDEIAAALRHGGATPSEEAAAQEISLTDGATAVPKGPAAPAPSSSSASAPDGPGTAPDGRQSVALRSFAFAPLALAGVGTIGGASGVRESVSEASALRWMQVTVISLLLAVFTVARTHLKARRGLARRFSTLAVALAPAAAVGQPAQAGAGSDGPAVFVVGGSGLFHQSGCDLLRFSPAQAVPAAEAQRQGLAPCQVCR